MNAFTKREIDMKGKRKRYVLKALSLNFILFFAHWVCPSFSASLFFRPFSWRPSQRPPCAFEKAPCPPRPRTEPLPKK